MDIVTSTCLLHPPKQNQNYNNQCINFIFSGLYLEVQWSYKLKS